MKNVTYINASAGSGKTYRLTHQLAELIKEGKVRPEEVIMTTFTTRAANEMKEEAKKVLFDSGLYEAATRLDQAMIGTIHSVANALIKKYWFFLGLSPDMGVMAEDDTEFYISQSLAELPTHDELKALHSFCETMGISFSYYLTGKNALNYDFWKDDIRKVIAFTTNYEIENYERSIEESLAYIRKFVKGGVKLDYSYEELRAVIDEHQAFLEGQAETAKKKARLTEIGKLRREIHQPTITWYKRLLGLLCELKKCGPLASQMRDQLADMWHSQRVYDEQERYIRILFRLAERWKDRFRLFKKERNLLDYNDMEKYLHDLLIDPQLSQEIAMDYRYLFVDEYQDCSPIQVKIFDRLSELMEHSYWVGDYKQAIFGFRGSDTTLTKAVVDRVATREHGCDTDRLGTSYRSLPAIVDVCNETFKRTLKDVLIEKDIVLEKSRKDEGHSRSLRYWKTGDPDGPSILEHIAALVQQGVKPSDIAVLGRKNAELNKIAGVLIDKYKIPASREELHISEMKATPLVMALLSLVASEKDFLAKAQIAFLTEEGYDTAKVIEEKLLWDADSNKEKAGFLDDVPLVRQMLALRPKLTQQSVSALIETMIIELDLYNVVKRMGASANSASCLDTTIKAGYTYEQHCLQMNLPATVNGFMDYLTVTDPVGSGDTNGVQLLTYHSSKGLQWPYVILTQLYEKKDDAKSCVRQNIYGIHFAYTEQPSVETPYPEVYIRVMPFIYGAGKTNVPKDIQQQIESSELFKKVNKDILAEENRLLYVGMTRPRDVLIMALEPHPKTVHMLQWLEDVGLHCAKTAAEPDLLGVGCLFEDDTLTPEQADALEGYLYSSEQEKMKTRRIPYQKEACEAEQKYLSPSGLHEKGDVVATYTVSEPMRHGILTGKTIADVGNCIHQIYCGIEQHMDSEEYYGRLIESYGLTAFLTYADDIRHAWQALTRWLADTYGEARHTYHERPFTLVRDGQVFTGSIDFVWQTDKGDILVDFKTCPLGTEYVLNSDSEHYAGWYAGQLDAYTNALEAAGEKVIKRLIYYPLSGLVAEVGKTGSR